MVCSHAEHHMGRHSISVSVDGVVIMIQKLRS